MTLQITEPQIARMKQFINDILPKAGMTASVTRNVSDKVSTFVLLNAGIKNFEELSEAQLNETIDLFDTMPPEALVKYIESAIPSFFESIALPLVERGLRVGPAYPKTKQVHGALTPDPLNQQSSDPEQIRGWGQQAPDANVIVYAEQKPGGVLFLDKDGDISLVEKYERETGKKFPQTLLVQSSTAANGTPKGHWYFLQTPRTIALDGNIPESKTGGLFSLRVKNYYVVSIGSVHPATGLPYTVVDDVPIAPMPDDFLDWLLAQVKEEPKNREQALERGKFTKGQRYPALISELGRMNARGYSPELMMSTGLAWAKEWFDIPEGAFNEGMVRKEIQHYIDHGYEQGQPTPDVALNQRPDNGAPADAAQIFTGEPRHFNPWEYALKPLYGIEFSGWFPLGRVTLISGSSGAMKTTFLAQALVAGRDGETFLGHEPGNLAFKFLFADRGKFDCEETFKRMNLVGKVPFESINGIPKHAAPHKLAEVAASGDYKVLVIDGGDLLVPDNNDGTSVGDFTLSVQRIAEHYGVSIIVTTGAGKMSPQALKQGAERRTITKGSEVWGRTGGSVFTLNSEHDGTQDTRRLVVQHRNAPTEKFLLQVRHGRLVAVNEAQLIEESRSKTILDWVLAQDTFTMEQAKKHFKWSGTTATERLTALVKTGVIKQHERKGTKRARARVWFEVPSTINALKKAAADYEKSKAENTVNLDDQDAST